jgi:hypothetical protein
MGLGRLFAHGEIENTNQFGRFAENSQLVTAAVTARMHNRPRFCRR